MHMSKQLFRITPLLISSIFLNACGGSSSSPDPSADGNSTNNTAPVANAGANVDITKGFIVNLNGSASSDSDGDTLAYEWTQTNGIDVTGGSGSLSGKNPAFSAPDGVDSLVFELKVNDGKVSSTGDTVVVNVYEDLNATYFVDGDIGDDSTGDGSRSNPFATLAKAISALTTNQEDIYMKTRAGGAAYDETASSVEIPAGTSVYGGYDANWVRDVETNKTVLNTDHRGMQFFNVIQDAWFSGFNLKTLDTNNVSENVYGVKAQGDKTSAFYVTDNIINNGQVAAGTNNAPGSNYGVVVLNLVKTEIRNNQILASNAGDGINGVRGGTGGNGDAGDAGTQTGGNRAAGGATGAGGNGGAGGTRGGGFNGSGGGGGKGGDKSKPLGGTASGGGGGAGGSSTNTNADSGATGGGGGLGSPGAAGNGTGLLTGTLFIRSNGSTGSRGGHGAGGGGGGGGKANNVGVIGGGGGGGGEGGEGGFGGTGGRGGGASIGVWLFGIVTSDITNNIISSAAGGDGTSGGAGGAGGARGTGGAGKAGDSGFFGAGGGGAKGGDGGTGGSGGYGGAGGGGPSYGVIFSAGMEPRFTGNTITSGSAGAGGNGGFRGNGGEGGYSYTIFDSNPDDAFFATVDQNMLINGSPGTGGSSSGFSGATAGNNGLSATNNWNL